tara:strand:- start:17699 stop:17875 length:177 start_codon:yes stop_codon:yes gene_type:complete
MAVVLTAPHLKFQSTPAIAALGKDQTYGTAATRTHFLPLSDRVRLSTKPSRTIIAPQQ